MLNKHHILTLNLFIIVFCSCMSTNSVLNSDYPEPTIHLINAQIIDTKKCYSRFNRIELATDSRDAESGIDINIWTFDIKSEEWLLYSNVNINKRFFGFDISSKMNARNHRYFALEFKNNKIYDLSIKIYDRELQIYSNRQNNRFYQPVTV